MLLPEISQLEHKDQIINGSVGEYIVLVKLASISKERGWLIYRSLRLENHPKKIEGEIDVVIFGNNIGIILLEVKGSNLKCIDGVWSIHNRGEKRWLEINDPFEQIKDASFAFRQETKQIFQLLRINPMISWGCVFPECDELKGTISYPKWKFCCASELSEIEIFIETLVKKEKNKLSNLDRKNIGGLDIKSAYNLIERLAPIHQEGHYINADYNKILIDLEHETEPVKNLMKIFSSNQFLFVEGGAGTGKTRAALYETERLLKDDKNYLIICRSKLLAQFLRNHLNNFDRKGLSKIMLSEELTDQDSLRTFDALIIDEAQDLVHEELVRNLIDKYYRCNKLLRIFGDFDCQNLFENKRSFLDWMKSLSMTATMSKLTINCRNTIQIGMSIKQIISLDDSVFSLGSTHGEFNNYRYNINKDSLIQEVRACIDNWVENENPISGITILHYKKDSPLINEQQLLNELNACHHFEKDLEENEYKISFCDVFDFKGLESPCIIFIIDRIDLDWQTIFYIALSRAKIKCHLLFMDSISSTELTTILCKITETK